MADGLAGRPTLWLSSHQIAAAAAAAAKVNWLVAAKAYRARIEFDGSEEALRMPKRDGSPRMRVDQFSSKAPQAQGDCCPREPAVVALLCTTAECHQHAYLATGNTGCLQAKAYRMTSSDLP